MIRIFVHVVLNFYCDSFWINGSISCVIPFISFIVTFTQSCFGRVTLIVSTVYSKSRVLRGVTCLFLDKRVCIFVQSNLAIGHIAVLSHGHKNNSTDHTYKSQYETRCSQRWQTLLSVPPLGKLDEWTCALSLILAHLLHYAKIWHHPQNRRYIT